MESKKYVQITLFEYIRHCDGLDTGDMKGIAKKVGECLGLGLKKNKDGYMQEKLGLKIGLSKNEKTGLFGISLMDNKGKRMILPTIADVCDILTRSFIHNGIAVKATA
jgi:hypothetical protein